MTLLEVLAMLFGVALVIGTIGFVRTVWFISLGYTVSIAVFVVLTAVLYRESLSAVLALQLAALLFWSVRLGVFLLRREAQAGYRSATRDQTDTSQSLPLIAKIGIWLAVAALYVCMVSPAIFLAGAGDTMAAWQIAVSSSGVAVMWLGVVLEALADRQKSRAKAGHPDRFVSSGFYAWVRYPNYLGEILVWVGNFLAAIVILDGWWQWSMASVGVVCIVLIMIGSTKRLEAKQGERYGNDPDFAHYTKSVPVLLPWIPVYTLQRVRVFLE